MIPGLEHVVRRRKKRATMQTTRPMLNGIHVFVPDLQLTTTRDSNFNRYRSPPRVKSMKAYVTSVVGQSGPTRQMNGKYTCFSSSPHSR